MRGKRFWSSKLPKSGMVPDMNEGSSPEASAVGSVMPLSEHSAVRIERQSLHDLVANRLRDLIIEGVLTPGTRLNESRLCEELGVSRTPLREAVKTLASEGLIEPRPGRGTVVRSFSAKDARDMLEVLTELEAMAGRLACEQASDAQIAEISSVHGQMVAFYRSGERLSYYKLNQAIHSMIVAATGNETLIEMHGMLQSRMKRLRFIGNSGAEKWKAALAEHEEMVDALKRRDGTALAEVLQRHLRNTWVRVADSF
jgi:DNA-binding GntR family transcriptional regulator